MIQPKVLNPSARRINYLANSLNSNSYLEVGVFAGETFLNVDIENKVAVDPYFRFEKDEYENDHTAFYQVESDAFFSKLAATKKFDIIFLDGLHTFEQTYRDFNNSLLHSYDHTVFVLDDVIPNDVYSAMNNARKAVIARKDAGIEGLAWHGDVYKLVFLIHDFYPSLSYCTIKNKGNPQTIVWKQARSDFTPLYNDAEIISRLDYFTFRDNLQIMNLMTEDSGLDYVLDNMQNSGLAKL